MGIVRNCIDIIGITPESELPSKIHGQHIEFSETENLLINSTVKIKNIYQIIVDTFVKSTREINTPLNKIFVIDGYKKFKIAYYDMENNMGVLELNTPFNLFFDIENDEVELEKTSLYIADAYFEMVNSNALYCYIIYIADIHYYESHKRLESRSNTIKHTKIEMNKELYNTIIDSENDMFKEAVFTEMSISEDSKKEYEDDEEIISNEKNDLIDIEAEYI